MHLMTPSLAGGEALQAAQRRRRATIRAIQRRGYTSASHQARERHRLAKMFDLYIIVDEMQIIPVHAVDALRKCMLKHPGHIVQSYHGSL